MTMTRLVPAVAAALFVAGLAAGQARAVDREGIDGVWYPAGDRGPRPLISLTIRSDNGGHHFARIVVKCDGGACPLPEGEVVSGSGLFSFLVRVAASPPFDTFQFVPLPRGAPPECPSATAEDEIFGAWSGRPDWTQCFYSRPFNLHGVKPLPSPAHPLPPGTRPPAHP